MIPKLPSIEKSKGGSPRGALSSPSAGAAGARPAGGAAGAFHRDSAGEDYDDGLLSSPEASEYQV
jgi:hypothetical protein